MSPAPDSPAQVVFCACPDPDTAVRLARQLVEEQLTACAQVLTAPIRSFYRWEGQVRDEAEVLLLLKTTTRAWPALRDRLELLHPYDVPEILACPAQGNPAYLQWMGEAGSLPPEQAGD